LSFLVLLGVVLGFLLGKLLRSGGSGCNQCRGRRR
jgi:hypothetical protein